MIVYVRRFAEHDMLLVEAIAGGDPRKAEAGLSSHVTASHGRLVERLKLEPA